MDKEKYKMLISEYKKFKTKNMKHFRFNSAANMSTYGEYLLGQLFKKDNHLVKAKRFSQPSNWWRSTLTRPPLTTSSEKRRSRRRPS